MPFSMSLTRINKKRSLVFASRADRLWCRQSPVRLDIVSALCFKQDISFQVAWNQDRERFIILCGNPVCGVKGRSWEETCGLLMNKNEDQSAQQCRRCYWFRLTSFPRTGLCSIHPQDLRATVLGGGRKQVTKWKQMHSGEIIHHDSMAVKAIRVRLRMKFESSGAFNRCMDQTEMTSQVNR